MRGGTHVAGKWGLIGVSHCACGGLRDSGTASVVTWIGSVACRICEPAARVCSDEQCSELLENDCASSAYCAAFCTVDRCENAGELAVALF